MNFHENVNVLFSFCKNSIPVVCLSLCIIIKYLRKIKKIPHIDINNFNDTVHMEGEQLNNKIALEMSGR